MLTVLMLLSVGMHLIGNHKQLMFTAKCLEAIDLLCM